MKFYHQTLCILIAISLSFCSEDRGVNISNPVDDTGWSLPIDRVVDGGVGKDGIIALESPSFVAAPAQTYLADEDLVIGYKNGDDIRAYPHRILDWHEIVNDEVNGTPLAITYCPLTGTAIGWDREIGGEVTTFGVSGLLYNSNLIPYDRKSNSNWSQMLSESVNGPLRGEAARTIPLIETSWKDWRSMYPSTLVLSNQTGFYNGDYGTYPYGSYKTSNNYLLFPVEPLNTRLEAKERVYAVIEGSRALVFRFDSFKDGPGVYNDKLLNEPIVVAGNKSENYMVAYKSTLEDGTSLSFKAVPRNGNIIMEDNAGNQWSIFGEAISGPRSGEKLSPCHAYMSYWFAVGAFFKDAKIFGEKLPEPN